jgi:hypothetical protein
LDFLVDHITKSEFYLKKSFDFNDPSFCAKADKEYILTGPGSDDRDCFFQLALNNKNADFCLKSRNKNSCFSRVLSLRDDIDFDIDMKYCNAMIDVGNVDLSPERQTQKKSYCIFLLVRKVGNYQMCNKISDQKVKDECYVYGANNLKDMGLCDMVQDKQKQKTCGNRSVLKNQVDNSQAPYYNDAIPVYFEGDIEKQWQEENKSISLLYGVKGSDWTFQNKIKIPCRITDAYECEKINIKLKSGVSMDVFFKVFDKSLCYKDVDMARQWPYCQIVNNLKALSENN